MATEPYSGKMTTWRRGSTPSDSERRPAAATASCTTFRSNGVQATFIAAVAGLDVVGSLVGVGVERRLPRRGNSLVSGLCGVQRRVLRRRAHEGFSFLR